MFPFGSLLDSDVYGAGRVFLMNVCLLCIADLLLHLSLSLFMDHFWFMRFIKTIDSFNGNVVVARHKSFIAVIVDWILWFFCFLWFCYLYRINITVWDLIFVLVHFFTKVLIEMTGSFNCHDVYLLSRIIFAFWCLWIVWFFWLCRDCLLPLNHFTSVVLVCRPRFF